MVCFSLLCDWSRKLVPISQPINYCVGNCSLQVKRRQLQSPNMKRMCTQTITQWELRTWKWWYDISILVLIISTILVGNHLLIKNVVYSTSVCATLLVLYAIACFLSPSLPLFSECLGFILAGRKMGLCLLSFFCQKFLLHWGIW